jgi:Rrf2 family transcriptional regulator, iron-sulfur cluster assembly transcription factor
MLSQSSEHALRAVLYLARQPGSGLTSADTVARALGAPRNYLAKMLNVLAKRGILVSLRGPGGGYRMGTDPETVTLHHVVEPFEDFRASPVCLLGDRPCSSTHPCEVHGRWSAVMDEVWAPLRTTTVATLLREPQEIKALAGSFSRHPLSAVAAE